MNYELPLAQILKREILLCAPETTVAAAAALMTEARVSSILVGDAEKIQGIWTEHDALALSIDSPQTFQQPIAVVMSSPVKTININKPAGEAAIRLKQERVRHLLVVDDQGKPAGIVTQTDVVNHQGIEFYVHMRSVDSVVRNQPLQLEAGLPLPDALRLMRQVGADAAIVRADGRFGIITGRDILRLIGQQVSTVPVGEVASYPLLTVEKDSTLYQARQIFGEKRIRHLGIMAQGEVIGLLTYADILDSVEQEYVRELQAIMLDQEARLQKSRLDLLLASKVAETSLQGIMITNGDGIIKSVNPAFTAITGYPPDEAIGRDTRLLRSGKQDADFYRAMYQALAEFGVWHGELWNRRRNGELFLEAVTITEVRNESGQLTHYVCVFTDISEQRRSQKALQESKARLRHQSDLTETILDTLPVMVFVKDEQGRFVVFNEQAVRVFGKGRGKQDLLGKTSSELFAPEVLSAIEQHEQEARDSAHVVVHEIPGVAPAGDTRYLVYRRAVRLEDESALMIGAAIDITARKRAERLLSAERQVLELVASDATLTEVLAALCREIEGLVPGARVAALLYDALPQRLRVGAAPSMAPSFCVAVEKLTVDARLGTCGPAILDARQYISGDVLSDARWDFMREALAQLEVRSVWSTPVVSRHDRVLGLFNLYFAAPTEAVGAFEQEVIEHACRLAAIAIERAESLAALQRLATVDTLTGVSNRSFFLEQAVQEIKRSRRFESEAGALMLDIDYFKRINDAHGHAAGDTALQKVSEVIRRELRGIDLLGRMGGEEFAVLLPDCDIGGLLQAAERIRAAVERTRIEVGENQTIPLTISIGATKLLHFDNIDHLLARADAALYRAKRSGRNRVVLAEEDRE